MTEKKNVTDGNIDKGKTVYPHLQSRGIIISHRQRNGWTDQQINEQGDLSTATNNLAQV